MNEQTESVMITKLHYRQLDFLKLFKLCREIGIVKRKRKMPMDYNDLPQGEDNARSACRRLLQSVIKHLFPGSIITSNRDHYYIEIPIEIRDDLSVVSLNLGRFEANLDIKIRNAARQFLLLREFNVSYVRSNFPYHISVYLRPEIRRNVSSVLTDENFYETALAVKECAEIYNTAVAEITEGVDLYEAYVENQAKLAAELKAKKAEERNKKLKDLKNAIVEDAATDVAPTTNTPTHSIEELNSLREDRIDNAQNAFNLALEKFRRG